MLLKLNHLGSKTHLGYNTITKIIIHLIIHFIAQIWRRNHAQELYMQPMEMFLPTEMTLDEWNSLDSDKKVFSGLGVDTLPQNVHIITVEDWAASDR